MNQKVKIVRVVPGESQRLTEKGSLLIMDILVKLTSGTLVNVEIQRIGYLFPGARCACYSSDLLLRQYTQVREDMRRKEAGISQKGGTIRLKNRLEAWLAFISSDKPEDILEVVRAYPDFRELYREVSNSAIREGS